ncbi:MAG: YegP family protein [Myxococcota bacterium]
MAGRYVLKASSDGQYMFNLKAGNGEIILTSERYSSKSSAEHGIDSVRTNSPLDSRYDRRRSTSDQPYFVLKAANGEVIGRSEMYSSTSAMENGIVSVKTNGPTATVDDQT